MSIVRLSEDRLLLIYFVAPLLLGITLGDFFALDASVYMREYFGLLESIELYGKSIKIKSMILLWAIILIPILWVYMQFHLSRTEAKSRKILEGMSHLKIIVVLLVGVPLVMLSLCVLLVMGLPVENVESSPRAVRVILGLVSYDVSFGFFSAGLIFTLHAFAVAAVKGGVEIVRRIKIVHL